MTSAIDASNSASTISGSSPSRSRSSSSPGESPTHVSRAALAQARGACRSKKSSYANWPLMSASEKPFSRMPAAVRSWSRNWAYHVPSSNGHQIAGSATNTL